MQMTLTFVAVLAANVDQVVYMKRGYYRRIG